MIKVSYSLKTTGIDSYRRNLGQLSVAVGNAAGDIEGNAKEILELRVARTGVRFGKPAGTLLDGPRNQTYAYGLDNIVDLAQERITVEEFARRTNITVNRAQKIKSNIITGRGYRWAKTYKKEA